MIGYFFIISRVIINKETNGFGRQKKIKMEVKLYDCGATKFLRARFSNVVDNYESKNRNVETIT